MEDNLNFKTVLLSVFNNKTSKTNGFDTIEIDLVLIIFLQSYKLHCFDNFIWINWEPNGDIRSHREPWSHREP